MSSHVLVSGGAGFVGQAVCAALVTQGVRVTAMVRRADVSLPKGVIRWVVPELPALSDDVVQFLSDVDVVIHAAGRAHMLRDQATDPLVAFRQVNTEGTLRLAKAAAEAGVPRFIFISSIGVNGSQSADSFFRPDDIPQPDSPYAQSKWEAEQGLTQLQKATGMTILQVRPPMIYGRNAPGNFSLLTRLVAKGWPLPFGSLNAPRSFVALDNLVDLLMHMVRCSDPPSGVYLVADAKITNTTQFIRAMARGMGREMVLVPLAPTLLLALARLIGRGDQVRKMSVPLAIDIEATKARLGWVPPFSMDQAMQRTFYHGSVPTALEPRS